MGSVGFIEFVLFQGDLVSVCTCGPAKQLSLFKPALVATLDVVLVRLFVATGGGGYVPRGIPPGS